MKVVLPDPKEVAAKEAAQINANREAWLDYPLQRVLIDAPYVQREKLLEGIEPFHRERMQRLPPAAKYPEAGPWVEHILAIDRELQRLTAMTDFEMAVHRSLHFFLLCRGFAQAAPAGDEKCRVAYLPESDRGRLHMKNVDDPAAHWKPEGRPTWLSSGKDQTLWSDGVGSGLHMDDEPEEIFPLPVTRMYKHYADDVPSAVEFLTRYSPFWGRANILLHDSRKRSAAIEKCSYNYIEVFYPGPDGRSHISGMTCRDPQSPQGRYQRAQREKYVRLFGQEMDGPDMAFWGMCRQFEDKLAAGLEALGPRATLDGLVRLFTRSWPEGLRKDGTRLHPKQGLIGYTLISYVSLLDEGKLLRWQRAALPELTYPDAPEAFEF